MIIAVLANGAWDSEWGKHVLEEVDYLICADGGANHAISLGFMPARLIGDLDSILPEYLAQCEQSGCLIERYPREKDETDLELALLEAKKKASLVGERDIWLYGGTGKRIDHFMGNLSLMLAYAHQGYRLRLVDPWHEMWVFQGNEGDPDISGTGTIFDCAFREGCCQYKRFVLSFKSWCFASGHSSWGE
ncbi:thiamine diphosphokinase [Desulfosporosinus sp. SB140]|uniref:thiamine diphosphokinase n=1 Tax=Desulfosporosinus paludis TaxID=3115649 RepID=UPI00388D6B67